MHMKIEEMRGKSAEELRTAARGVRIRQDQIRLDRQQGKVKNVKEYGSLRRELARILTVLKEKS